MTKWIQELEKAETVALFTHVIPDGDAIGSIFGLGCVLEGMGKQADIYINEKIPDRLIFLADTAKIPYLTEPDKKVYDLCISLDCGDEGRLGGYGELYHAAKATVNIDHHVSNTYFGGYNVVDSKACSTGEIVYRLCKEEGLPVDKRAATLFYAAIASDTGCFQFSNTNESAHIFAAELLKSGADIAEVNKLLFNTNDLAAMQMRAFAIQHLEFFYGGRAACITVLETDMDRLGVSSEDAEGLSDIPRSIRGVEVGVVLRQWKGKIKGSIRTNRFVDASALAQKFGGGGHIRAAGFVSDLPAEKVKEKFITFLEELL